MLPSKIHLTVPKDFRKRPPSDVILHKSELEQCDVHAQGLLRYTTPIRTIVDLLEEHFSNELLGQAPAEGLERGSIRTKELQILEQKAAGLDGSRRVRIGGMPL